MTTKKTVLITGCSDGSLGAALATAFTHHGWRVFASARNLNKVKQTEAQGIEVLQLDTLSEESIAVSVARISKITGGSLDLLLNNAGAGYCMPILDLDLAQTRDLFELNVFSLITISRAFFPLLAKSSHGGIIVNNTSCSSLPVGAFPFCSAYNASKAAAASFTENMRLEFEPFGVRVINLMTGSVKSTFHDNAPKASLPPNSLYNAAKEAIEKSMSGKDNYATGADPASWADQVASDLSKSHPPHWLWRGNLSFLARIGSHLPIGMLDKSMKKRVGLDVFEQRVREKGGPQALKIS